MANPRTGEKKGFWARWARLSLRSKGVVVLTIPLAALILAQIAIYGTEGEMASLDKRVIHFYEIRAELSQLRNCLGGAEASIGAFSSTGERQYASMFDLARDTCNQSMSHLATLMVESPGGPEALKEIKKQADLELQALASIKNGGADAAFSLRRARTALAAAQTRATALAQQEDSEFSSAAQRLDNGRQRLFYTLMALGIAGPLGALLMNLVVAGRLSKRIQAVEENARRLAHGLPLEAFARGSDEISALAHQIEDAAFLLRQREREVKESERRYRDLFDRAPIAFEETDREGVIRRFNQAVCNLLKNQPDQVLGRKAWDFVAPDQQESFRQQMLDRVAAGVESDPFECDYMLEDGSRITLEVRENLIRDDREQVTGVVRSLLDVTERNLADMAARKVTQYAMELRNKNEQLARALEAARSATEAKSRFLAGVSHELRTPLNGIIGFSEMMYDGKLGPITEDHKDVLSDILTSARHLLQLINDILDLSKVEAGRMEFRPESSRIDTLVFEVRDVVRPLAEKKHLKLSISVPADLTAVIDPARFKQVLYNYLSNAVKFTPVSGRVDVRISREENSTFRLEVEDTGIGIAADEISKLFQEFQQLPNSRKADQGTGLGLALTRHIVEAQGGSVSVRSEPGQGSVFAAMFPLVSIPIPVEVPR